MVKRQEFWFPAADELGLCAGYLWEPDSDVRAVVQIVHGIGEHMGRYDNFARFLAMRGFLVCGEDHLGHGKTGQRGGKLGFFRPHRGWEVVTETIHKLRTRIGGRYPQVPYFLLGHSMGSFLTRTYLCQYPGSVQGAILSGTGQEPAPLVWAGYTLANLICHLKGADSISPLIHQLALGNYNRQFAPNRTSADWLSRDEKVVNTYLADPLCTFTPTVGLYRDMLGGLRLISNPKFLSRMDPHTPIYLFSGDCDPVGGNGAGVRRVLGYFQEQGTCDLSMKLYPGARHETLNELNATEVYEDVLGWLKAHL